MRPCDYHIERRAEIVEATHEVQDEAFCEECFSGKPLAWDEDLLPSYLKDDPVLFNSATNAESQCGAQDNLLDLRVVAEKKKFRAMVHALAETYK